MPKRERRTSSPPRLASSLSHDTTSDDTSTESHSGDDVSAGPRPVLPFYNKLDRVVEALASAQRIVVIAGAGISVSCGIPDFRSANGIYKMVQGLDNLGLASPEELFDLKAFRRDPRPFYRFAPALYPGAHAPSLTHRFLRMLELQGKLLRVYTQNIDGLEALAGIECHVACHGSFASAACQSCGRAFSAAEIREDVMSRQVPRCPSRDCEGVIKPNITFFGEKLGCDVSRALQADRSKADLLLVIGTSLKVAPVSRILQYMPARIPQILINRDMVKPPASISAGFDSYLLGDCDSVVEYLCRRLGCEPPPPLSEEELAANLAAAVGVNTAAGAEAAAGLAAISRNKRARKRAGTIAEASTERFGAVAATDAAAGGTQAAGKAVAEVATKLAAAAQVVSASVGQPATKSEVDAGPVSQQRETLRAPAISQSLPEEVAVAEAAAAAAGVAAIVGVPVEHEIQPVAMEEDPTTAANEALEAAAAATALVASGAEPVAMDAVAVGSRAAALTAALPNASPEPPVPAQASVMPVAKQASSLKAELLRRLAAAAAPEAVMVAAAAEAKGGVLAVSCTAAAAEPAAATAVMAAEPVPVPDTSAGMAAAAAGAELVFSQGALQARQEAVAMASSPVAMAAVAETMEVDAGATSSGEAGIATASAAAAAPAAEVAASALVLELIEAVFAASEQNEPAAAAPSASLAAPVAMAAAAVAPAAAATFTPPSEIKVNGGIGQVLHGSFMRATAAAPVPERGEAAAAAAAAGGAGSDLAVAGAGSDLVVAMDVDGAAAAGGGGGAGVGSGAGSKATRFAVLTVITDMVSRVAGDASRRTAAATSACATAQVDASSIDAGFAAATVAAPAGAVGTAAFAAAADGEAAALPPLQPMKAKPTRKDKKGKGRSGKAKPRSQGLTSPRRSSPRWQDFKFKPPNVYHFAGFIRSPRTVARANAVVKAHAEALAENQLVEVVSCDACEKTVAPGEAIHSCRECFDYDLCVRCFSRGRNEHTRTLGHGFQRTDANFRGVDVDDDHA